MNPHGSDDPLIAGLFSLPVSEQAAYWQRACAGDPELPRRWPDLARRFEADPRAVVAAAAVSLPAATIAPSAVGRVLASALELAADRETPGQRIGRYKLLQKIGEGGFGVVWMAEQVEPLHRRVALKIVKAGIDTDEVVARFEAERQALALMDHPNIARVFDAGATASGRPYFVMELVRGLPITRYCDENRVDAEARLRLFVCVCHAVQHAHQKGVIHRDLKPSNILITLHDGVPVPKVIDFGVAKATDKPLTERTLVTQFHAFVGTPVYTSPEQMEMSGLDVDTRSDIYSLGVLLYEMLAGRPPFDADALLKAGFDAMRRTIREVEPPQPSDRLRTLSDVDRTTIAGQRGTDPAKLSTSLRGDLDCIVMHCLEKDRTRRYESAAALAHDVEHHLAHEPVIARRPSAAYRIRKFIRRHQLGFAAIVAIALSLVGGLFVASIALVREHAARTRAVAAERSEARLRAEAEAARTEEAIRAGRASLALAERFFQEGNASAGVAHLVRAARSDPANSVIGPRLVAALAQHRFPAPVGPALVHPAPVAWATYLAGDKVLTYADDGWARVWDYVRPEVLVSFRAGDGVVCTTLSRDRQRLAICRTNGLVDVVDLTTGRLALPPLDHDGAGATWVKYVRFSPDGRWLISGGADRTAKIWDAATGDLRSVLPHEFGIGSIEVTPDSGIVCTVQVPRGPWKSWRLPDGTPVASAEFDRKAVKGNVPIASRDGRLVLITDNSGAQMYDVTTGAKVGARLQHTGPCYFAAFSHDGRLAATSSDDGTVRLWSVPSGAPVGAPLVQPGPAFEVSFTADDRGVVSVSSGHAVFVWDVQTGHLVNEPIRGITTRPIALSADTSEILVGKGDGVLRRWRLGSECAMPLRIPVESGALAVDAVPEGTTLVAVARDRLWKANWLTGELLGPPRRLPAPVKGFMMSPNGRFWAVSTELRQELWDLGGAEVIRHPLDRPTSIVRFSEDSSRFAFVDDRSFDLFVWATAQGRQIAGPMAVATGRFAFSDDARQLAIGGESVGVDIYDLDTGGRIGEPLRYDSALYHVAFSPDRTLIATSGAAGTQLWDGRTHRPEGAPLRDLIGPRGALFTRDGRRLVTWTRQEVRAWDLSTRVPLSDPILAGTDIIQLALTDDGTRVATYARATGEVRIWGAVSGQPITGPLAVGLGGGMQAGSLIFLDSGRFLRVRTPNALWIVAVPPQSGRKPIPEWLLQLATAVAGGEIDSHAVFRDRIAEPAELDRLRREVNGLPDDAPYAVWGRWLLANPATRPIAPGFQLRAADVARLTEQLTRP